MELLAITMLLGVLWSWLRFTATSRGRRFRRRAIVCVLTMLLLTSAAVMVVASAKKRGCRFRRRRTAQERRQRLRGLRLRRLRRRRLRGSAARHTGPNNDGSFRRRCGRRFRRRSGPRFGSKFHQEKPRWAPVCHSLSSLWSSLSEAMALAAAVVVCPMSLALVIPPLVGMVPKPWSPLPLKNN